MNTVQRIAKNATVLVVSRTSSHLIGFFSVMYTARHLGPDSFGIISFALAFTTIFAILGDLGLHSLSVREIARDKSLTTKYLINVSLIKIVLCIIAFGLIALTVNFMDKSHETIKVVYIFGAHIVVLSFSQLFYAIFQAHEKIEYQGIGQILSSAIILVGVIIAIRYNFSIVGFASLYLVSSIIALLYGLIVLKLKFFTSPAKILVQNARKFNWRFCKSKLRQALPFGLTATFIVMFFNIDLVMLSLMKDDLAAGYYSAAQKMILFLLFIPIAFNLTLFPIMSNFYKTSQNALRVTFEKYFKYMVILSIPIAVGITILAPRIILIIFGPEFAPSALALQVLVWAVVLHFINSPFGRLFEAVNKPMLFTRASIINILFNITFNAILIPKYGYVGACAASIGSSFIVLILCFLYSSGIDYRIPGREAISTVTKVIIASTAMGAFTWYLRNANIFAVVVLAAVFYFVILYLLRGFSREDIALIKKLQGKADHT